jgi:hypothetical protein
VQARVASERAAVQARVAAERAAAVMSALGVFGGFAAGYGVRSRAGRDGDQHRRD